VLDIGCGTGRAAEALAARGSRVWGVEPEPEMASLARERVSTVKVAPAERLPFKDGWFERALMWLVVHLVDRPGAFAEAARVLGADGRLAIGTFHPEHFERYWLKRFFPSLEAIDKARFPTPDGLKAELEQAGFARVELRYTEQAPDAVRMRGVDPASLTGLEPATARALTTLAVAYNANASILNSLLFTYMDYAAIGYRPAA
jgi:ubiquinone/menaquinone biosynthesis C-methylase UbiE